jgi:hypothetical protein
MYFYKLKVPFKHKKIQNLNSDSDIFMRILIIIPALNLNLKIQGRVGFTICIIILL